MALKKKEKKKFTPFPSSFGKSSCSFVSPRSQVEFLDKRCGGGELSKKQKVLMCQNRVGWDTGRHEKGEGAG